MPESGLRLERLHKLLASRGVASRRACEDIIAAGRVTVDGKVVREVGTKVLPEARITVDGGLLHDPPKVYFLLNKPCGYVTTLSDDRGRKSVGQLLKRLRTRVYPVGRLDAETQGLLLVTNDGALTNVMTHPRFSIEKTYLVTVRGKLEESSVQRLRSGVYLSEGRVWAKVKVLRSTRETTRLEMVINQGYNRQIRRMCAAVGHEVKRLQRVRFGPLRLRGLPCGAFRALTKYEIDALMRLARGKVDAAEGARFVTRRGGKN